MIEVIEMATAKIFESGGSQAVRLPKDYRFDEKEVYINKVGNVVMLIPKDDPWEDLKKSLKLFPDDFMKDGRPAQGVAEEREDF